MLIALSQLTTGPDPAKNLDLIEEQARRAADAGARVVVLPEAAMACFGTPSPRSPSRSKDRGRTGCGPSPRRPASSSSQVCSPRPTTGG